MQLPKPIKNYEMWYHGTIRIQKIHSAQDIWYRGQGKALEWVPGSRDAEKVEKDFNYNLYRDVSDLYNKNNSQRQYYTAPSTTIPNKQTEFAKWLYLAPPTCKEDTIRCVPETTQPPLPGKGLEYLQMID